MIQTRADNSKLTIWYGLNGFDQGLKMQKASPAVHKGSKAAIVVPTKILSPKTKPQTPTKKSNVSTSDKGDPKNTQMDPKSILVSSKGSQANAKEIKKTLNTSSLSSPITASGQNQPLLPNVSSSSNVASSKEPILISSSLSSPKEDLYSDPQDFLPAPPIPDSDWDAQPLVPAEFRSKEPEITKNESNFTNREKSRKETEANMTINNSLLGVINTSLESDPEESDIDLFKKMTKKDLSVESELDESIFSVEDDDDFKVHFVHHGKKSSESEEEMNHRPDLAQQITELQEAVVCMKASLREAVTNLSLVVNDSSSGAQVEQVKNKCEGNSAEILKMVLALRTDLSSLKNDVTFICNRQDSLQKSVSLLLEDRKALANDLSHAGVISQHTRNRLDCFNGVVEMIGTGGHSGSGSHSNDSGVALMLEKNHGSFGDENGTLQSSSGNRISDQDSLPEQPSLLVPASVYDYVAGLNQPNLSLTSTTYSSHGNTSDNHNSEPSNQLKEESEARILDNDEGTCVGYESDSSLTLAANKTISLSTSLSQEMMVNDVYVSQSTQTKALLEKSKKKKTPREEKLDSSSKDSSSQSRRRRPLLGVSSTKMYQMTSHQHSTGEKDRHRHKHRQSPKGDSKESQRYKIAKELLDTEKKYCKTLWTIQETFAEPLKKAAILSNKDIATLFPEEVYQLYDKHCLLQHQLKERLTSWKWQPIIGDILARFTDPRHCEILQIYNNYVNDFPEILKTFHKLCHTSQPFTEFIKGCLDQPSCGGQDLGAFLLTPVQRIPRYILLLKQLLKYTDSTHPDYRQINTCLERLRDFLARLNDAMENSFRLVHSSLVASAKSASGSVNTSSKYRASRSPRRTNTSDHSPSSSPTDRRNRHTRIYQPSSTSTEAYRSPQRSCSNAGPNNQKQAAAHIHLSANRSASLPRGFLSSSDSPESSGVDAGPESSPERSRARSGSTSRCLQKSNSTSHEGASYNQASSKYHQPLTSARSVTNVTLAVGTDESSRWEDFTSSEPSLVDPKIGKSLTKGALSAAHSAQNVASSHKLVTWTDSIETEDARAKKKSSIKSSIKNMFGFKKSRGGTPGTSTKNGREEPIYWPSSISSVILENSDDSPQQQYSTVTTIGDFVDEDGNPCSNV